MVKSYGILQISLKNTFTDVTDATNNRTWTVQKASINPVVSMNGYVYASGWTRDGNVREYRLYSSLQKLLFNCSEIILNELESVKQKFVLPF